MATILEVITNSFLLGRLVLLNSNLLDLIQYLVAVLMKPILIKFKFRIALNQSVQSNSNYESGLSCSSSPKVLISGTALSRSKAVSGSLSSIG